MTTLPVPPPPPQPAERGTSENRPFRFALGGISHDQIADIAAAARWASSLGFAIILVPDHHDQPAAPLFALLAAAHATESLRVGTMVLDNDFRHPAVLAKELATLDVLSGGRLEAGIGAGWNADEYRQTGIPFDPPATRVDRLGEALQIMRGLLAGEKVVFHGRHYQINGLELTPRPAQRPSFPILVGGGGPRVLSLAGRYADIVNITHVGGGLDGMNSRELTAVAMSEKVARVGAAAVAAGRDRAPELGTNLLGISVTDDPEAAAVRHLGRLASLTGVDIQLGVEGLLSSPAYLIGTQDEMVEILRQRRQDFGLSYYYVPAFAAERIAPVIRKLGESNPVNAG